MNQPILHSCPGCLACQTLSGEILVPGGIIAENDWWLADHCLGAYGIGSVVVKTKAHRETMADLSANEAAALGFFLQQISAAMEKALGAERIYINLWMDEAPFHVHFVLQPRYPGKEELGLKGIELQVFRALDKPPAAAQAAAAAIKIREQFNQLNALTAR
ncbi:MAG: diadenosine tetraphosphate hydrolase [Cyanobacteria bacterium P01_H01_bin.119]